MGTECQEKLGQLKHQSEPVCRVPEIYEGRHLYYQLSLPESDRHMLVVQMFTKLILLCLRATSDLHATFAMANHSLHTELAAPTLPKKMERAGPDLAQSESHQPHPPTHLLMLGLRPWGGR